MAHRIGVIGGSGLYAMADLRDVHEITVETPFGPTSDAIIHGTLDGIPMYFLPRHGRGHRLNPTEVPYRANIWALKSLGVGWVISVSAVGSLQENIAPGHMVCVDQFIDRTRLRASTFFEKGIVAHVGFGDPVDPDLHKILIASSKECGAVTHESGTYVCMEGPQFSTRAESESHRALGAHVIGMTNLPEAKLAREAELAYATLAMSTDYDCWYEGHASVTVDQVIAVLHQNVALSQRIIRAAAGRIAAYEGQPPSSTALRNAVMTSWDLVPADRKEALRPIVGKYLP